MFISMGCWSCRCLGYVIPTLPVSHNVIYWLLFDKRVSDNLSLLIAGSLESAN